MILAQGRARIAHPVRHALPREARSAYATKPREVRVSKLHPFIPTTRETRMADAAHGTEHDNPPTSDDAPASQLRRISIHVIEPGPGRYHWVLLEQGVDPTTWGELLTSQRPCRHWNHALTDGMACLLYTSPSPRD